MKKPDISIERFNSFRKEEIISMMTIFYASPAVSTNGSPEIFDRDFEECLKGNLLEGFLIKFENQIIGYFIVSKSFSTEFAKPILWLEDFYIKEEFRYKNYSNFVFYFIDEKYSGYVLKLEVENNNIPAVSCYKRNGLNSLPYHVFYKEID